ncbi:MAG: tRNA (adenosine(37)-N6)-dimethylallyltransferase MiaA [Sphingobacteriales bacterium]|nr:tRNA (adenosine(37)-N6)-dimethylallyltransferase MiaA [Sphingobacteriales bacterium]
MIDSCSKYLIVIAGPTAVGKTAVAIQLAKQYHTEIISADSRQLFKELNIGVARPGVEELAEVQHHFIANKSISENVSAGEYEREVLALLQELYKKKDVVVLCGGTGFYINALLYGFDEIPSVDPAIREMLNQRVKEKGIEPLQQQLGELDPETFHAMDIHNPQRVIRALEVCIGTGQKFSSFKKSADERESSLIRLGIIPIKIGLKVSKEQLHHNIHTRVDEMMRRGFLEEAKSVYPFRNHNALQTVGYKELFDCIEGKTTLEAAVELIKLHTRQYAKRQLTFFHKNSDYTWFEPAQIRKIIDFIDGVIK